MINYVIKEEYLNCSTDEVWDKILEYIKRNGIIHSIRKVKYTAKVERNVIRYKGEGLLYRDEEGDTMFKNDFIMGYNAIYKAFNESPYVNTSTLKSCIPVTLSHRKGLFIGLLLSAGIMENSKQSK